MFVQQLAGLLTQALRTGALITLNVSMPQLENQKPSLPLVVYVDAVDAAYFCCRTGYCIAFIYNWRMALLITGAGPLIALGGILHMKLTFGQSTGADKLYGTANSAVTEAVSSIRVIQVYVVCRVTACRGAGYLLCYLFTLDGLSGSQGGATGRTPVRPLPPVGRAPVAPSTPPGCLVYQETCL